MNNNFLLRKSFSLMMRNERIFLYAKHFSLCMWLCGFICFWDFKKSFLLFAICFCLFIILWAPRCHWLIWESFNRILMFMSTKKIHQQLKKALKRFFAVDLVTSFDKCNKLCLSTLSKFLLHQKNASKESFVCLIKNYRVWKCLLLLGCLCTHIFIKHPEGSEKKENEKVPRALVCAMKAAVKKYSNFFLF